MHFQGRWPNASSQRAHASDTVRRMAHTNMMPLVERLTMGSCAGSSGSFLTNDSVASGDSATRDHSSAIVSWGPSNVEPGSYPDVLDRQSQSQKQLYRHRQQYAHCEKLESQVLQDTRPVQKLLLKWITRKQAKRA